MQIKPLVNWKRLIITIWILLWVILFMLTISKLLFHQWYPIIINNNKLINICNYIDNHEYLKISISTLFYCLNCVITFMTTTKQKRYNYIWIPMIFSLSVICNVIKYHNNTIGIIIEIILQIILPIIYNIKKDTFNSKLLNILMPIIINLLLMLWQLNILFIRDIQELLKDMPTLISLALQTDYYIFLIITWMGVVQIMSTWGLWFFGKSLTQLKALKAKEEAKENPDKVYLARIEKEIAKKEGE